VNIRALSYLGAEVTDLDAWERFGTEFLGTPAAREGNERLRLRMDERAYRFDLRQGAEDRLLWLGWEVSTRSDLHAAVAELRTAGVEVVAGTDDEAKDRGVVELAAFNDPAGNRNELFYGQQADFRPLVLTRPMSGYLTGELGMGHAVIGVQNYRECFDFYVDTLGFRVSDTFKNFIAFLHCNPRHHSLALVESDKPGLRHVMLETITIDDVGLAIDIAQKGGYLSRTLGRHTNDKAVSFYAETPSKWEIEYGWSGLQVDDEVWIVRQLIGPTSLWGHEPIGDRQRITATRG
jgi:2,3-dihydroxybiphenyl 1,2-dioxygenase